MLILPILLFASIGLSYHLIGGNCSQEYANLSNSCGGVGTGVYNNSWTTTPENVVDADWETFSPINGVDNNLYVNYSVPQSVNSGNLPTNATFVIKIQDHPRYPTINISVPSTCFNSSRDVKFWVHGASGQIWAYCLTNDQSYQNIYYLMNAGYFYEENITWTAPNYYVCYGWECPNMAKNLIGLVAIVGIVAVLAVAGLAFAGGMGGIELLVMLIGAVVGIILLTAGLSAVLG